MGLFSWTMQLILPATYSSSNTLKFEAVISSEKSVGNYLSIWRRTSFINKAVRTKNRTLFCTLKYPLLFISYIRCHGIMSQSYSSCEILNCLYHPSWVQMIFSTFVVTKQVIFPVLRLSEQCSCLSFFFLIFTGWYKLLQWKKKHICRIQYPSFILRLAEV